MATAKAPMKRSPYIVFVENRRREEEAASGRKLSLQDAVSRFGPQWTVRGITYQSELIQGHWEMIKGN